MVVISWLKGFARFWYRFVIGDDPLIALAVGVALALTYLLVRLGVSAWWLVPVVAVAAVARSLAGPGGAR